MIGAAMVLGILQLLLESVAARTQQGDDWGWRVCLSGCPDRVYSALLSGC